jgi:hypothetical protein
MTDHTDKPVAWAKFVEENKDVFPAPSTPAWLHRNQHDNGLAESGALVKVGGRWYVFPLKFWAWFATGARDAA